MVPRAYQKRLAGYAPDSITYYLIIYLNVTTHGKTCMNAVQT